MIKICFVCTGNTCRSIMAERLMKKAIKEKNIADVKVSSKGLCASGENIAENAKKALKQFKALASNRKSVKLKKTDKDTLYVVMSQGMKERVASERVITMSSLVGHDILDPYGQNLQVYIETAREIIKAIEILIEKIVNWREK